MQRAAMFMINMLDMEIYCVYYNRKVLKDLWKKRLVKKWGIAWQNFDYTHCAFH